MSSTLENPKLRTCEEVAGHPRAVQGQSHGDPRKVIPRLSACYPLLMQQWRRIESIPKWTVVSHTYNSNKVKQSGPIM